MEKLEQNSISILESIEYLKPGPQTEITERIKEIAGTIEGSFEEKISSILDIVSDIKTEQENKNDVFRKRTADQILNDNFVTGCTDVALVFIALSRVLGMPAKYIETIDEPWLQNGGESIVGHVYVKVFDGSRWRIIDPIRKVIDADIQQDKMVIFREGLDSWDIGIDSFNSLSEAFNNFRSSTNQDIMT